MILSVDGKPTYWKQGVKLLRSPVEVGVEGVSSQQESHLHEPSANSLVKVSGLFDSGTGDLKVAVSFANQPSVKQSVPHFL